jgi:OmpA-OmpF porin, OOP family
MPPPRLAAISATLAVLTLGAAPAFACPQYDRVVAAVEADDAAVAERLHEEIAYETACDDALREWLGDYLARDSFLAAMRAEASPAERRERLRRALSFEKHWRSYAELGRIDWSERHYGSAAVNFQLAINELVEGDPTHPADISEIAEVYEMASAALALADGAVEMPRTRSGEIGGIFKTSIRGFEVEEVELPITFRFASTDFDERGAEYADMLVEHLQALGPVALHIDGHTDPVGSEDYNLALSIARADAVRGFLEANGFSGTVETRGYGESRLPDPPPGIEAHSEEHYRLARRVGFSVE